METSTMLVILLVLVMQKVTAEVETSATDAATEPTTASPPALIPGLNAVPRSSAPLYPAGPANPACPAYLAVPAYPACPACPACPECPTCPRCPAQKPKTFGYQYHVGLGLYKMHYQPRTWHEAEGICERDGGHLIIINSKAEADMASELMKKYKYPNQFIHVGFFDSTHKGDYVTVLGDQLSTTGYEKWAPKEPNNVGKENCGSLYPYKGLNDMLCWAEKPFICELPD